MWFVIDALADDIAALPEQITLLIEPWQPAPIILGSAINVGGESLRERRTGHEPVFDRWSSRLLGWPLPGHASQLASGDRRTLARARHGGPMCSSSAPGRRPRRRTPRQTRAPSAA